MSILVYLISQLLGLYDFLLLVYVIMSWLPSMQNNQWMLLLRRIMEPVLTPIRNAMVRFLPRGNGSEIWHRLDLSPIVAWVLLSLIRKLLVFLL